MHELEYSTLDQRTLSRNDQLALAKRQEEYQKAIEPFIPQIDEVIDLIAQRVRDESRHFVSDDWSLVGSDKPTIDCQVAVSGEPEHNEAQIYITQDEDNGDVRITKLTYLSRFRDGKGGMTRSIVFRKFEFHRRSLPDLAQLNPTGADPIGTPWLERGVWNFGEWNFPCLDNLNAIDEPRKVLNDFKKQVVNWMPVGNDKGVARMFDFSAHPEGAYHGGF